MPYIDPDKREEVDNLVPMVSLHAPADGRLNYLLFAVCKRSIPPSYTSYKNFCGELRQCATEIERRLLGPYEDMKIIENGDV